MTAHALERMIGWYLLGLSGTGLLVYGVIAWGTRDERRPSAPSEDLSLGGVDLYAPQWPSSPTRRPGDPR